MAHLIRGAVLEGCSASGKTSVLKALKLRQAELDVERSVVILGEHYSQALQRIRGEQTWLTRDEHRRLLAERLDALESLHAWAGRLGPGSRNARGVFFVLERFHLNHRMSYEDDAEWTEGVERRLANLHAMCFLLTVSESRVPLRIAARLAASATPHDANHVTSASRSFVEQQARFVEASRCALVPTVLLNTDDQDWSRCANAILDRLGAQSE